GAYDDAVRDSFRGTHFEQRDNANQIIESAPIPSDRRLITTHRKQLLAALRDACLRSGVTIQTSAEVVGATPRGELQFATGETVRADLAVGVDGVWSKVRQTLGLETLHEQTVE